MAAEGAVAVALKQDPGGGGGGGGEATDPPAALHAAAAAGQSAAQQPPQQPQPQQPQPQQPQPQPPVRLDDVVPDVKPPADPHDPEVVAAALTARITGAGASIIFEKALTASDVSGGGRVVVPKSVAEQFFPKLDQPSGVSISASDLEGRTYTFKWRFWVNNTSRMYLLEGAGELHRNYSLEVGDVMVFAQKPDGSLVVAGRVANKSDLTRRPALKRPVAAMGGGGGAGGGGPGARGKEARAGRTAPRAQVPVAAADAAGAAAAGAAGMPAAARGGATPGGGGGAAAGAAAAAPFAARKRKASAPAPGSGPGSGPGPAAARFRPRSEEGASLAVLEMEAPSDGVFRAVVLQHAAPVPLGVALARNNRWTATLDVAGERYQAFFDTREDAVEAVTAAGACP